MELLISTLITMIGWYAAYRLAVRAQDQSLRLQWLDRARTEITDAIRDYQEWLGSSSSAVRWPLAHNQDGGTPDWARAAEELLVAITNGDAAIRWNRRLEDYAPLFPETAKLRVELQQRDRSHRQLLLDAQGICLRLALRPEPSQADIVALERLNAFSLDQVGLLEDLRIHVQNRVFGSVFRRNVPVREPRDPAVPRLAADSSGSLHVLVPGEATPRLTPSRPPKPSV